MPSLDDILKETMLMAAAKGQKVASPWVKSGHTPPLAPPFVPPFEAPKPQTRLQLRMKGYDAFPPDMDDPHGMIRNSQVNRYVERGIENNPIWHYQPPQFATVVDDAGKSQPVVRVSAVTCLVCDTDYKTPMIVCDSIEWGPVSVKLTDEGSEVQLPLTAYFQIKERAAFLDAGYIKPGAASLWPLEARTDASFQLVFGYAMTAAGKARKLTEGEWGCPALMPSADAGEAKKKYVATGKANVLCSKDPVIIVCVTLVTGKERANFEPGGVLGAGRINPMILVMSSVPLAKLKGHVTLARPMNAGCCTHQCDKDDEIGKSLDAARKAMTKNLGSAFFTDANELAALPLPYWDIMFDYYNTEPLTTEFHVVKRIAESTTRNKLGWIGDREVFKVAGQGEYDNIHMAPRMIARLDLPPEQAKWYKTWGLDRIVMAPFCVHDCFHTHWRWGADSPAQALGWDGETPYAKARAPQVPPNQKVTINLLTLTSFRYEAEAVDVKAGRWQVIMHHGSAYALSVRPFAEFVKAFVNKFSTGPRGDDPENPDDPHEEADEEWAMFYWHLRYDVVSDIDFRWSWRFVVRTKQYHERIRFTKEEMRKLALK